MTYGKHVTPDITRALIKTMKLQGSVIGVVQPPGKPSAARVPGGHNAEITYPFLGSPKLSYRLRQCLASSHYERIIFQTGTGQVEDRGGKISISPLRR